ncbi:MAG: acyltransferase family protein [bacterium]
MNILYFFKNLFKIDIPEHSLEYNRSIDGLRGVAVILVILFHFFPSIFSFGYVGVDIFFVISGYLITKIIVNQILNEKFSLLIFYRNRIRRIFPAMLVVICFSLLMGYLFLWPEFYQFLSKHVNASLVFQENFRLLKEGSKYWDIDSKYKPLLHFWSLSIEEQFYIFWPFILLISFYFFKKRNFLANLFFIVFIFLVLFMLALNLNLGYYHSLSRFWGLALGGILAFIDIYLNYFNKNESFKNKIQLFFSNYQALFFLIFLISILFNYNIKNFSIFHLFLVDLSTFLLIFSFIYKENNLFSRSFLWYSGVISYSLYLWHHVLLSFNSFFDNPYYDKIYNIDNSFFISFKLVLILILSYIFSHLTYKFIEYPFRKIKESKYVIFLLIISFILIQISYYIDKNKGLDTRLHIIFDKYAKNFQVIQSNIEGLKLVKGILGYEPLNDGIKSTTDDINNSNFILLIGDSHAFHLYEGLAYYLKRINDYNLLLISNSGNAPFYKDFIISPDTPTKDIPKYLQQVKDIYKVVDYLYNDKKLKKIIFSIRLFTYYFSYDHGILSDNNFSNNYSLVFSEYFENPRNYNHKIIFERKLRQTLYYFSKLNCEFYFIIDIPNLGFDPKVYSYSNFELSNFFKKIFGIYFFKCIDKIPYNLYYEKQGRYSSYFIDIIKYYPKVKIIDLSKVICDENYCYIIKDNQYLYLDDDHLNISGSLYVAPYILKEMNINIKK